MADVVKLGERGKRELEGDEARLVIAEALERIAAGVRSGEHDYVRALVLMLDDRGDLAEGLGRYDHFIRQVNLPHSCAIALMRVTEHILLRDMGGD